MADVATTAGTPPADTGINWSALFKKVQEVGLGVFTGENFAIDVLGPAKDPSKLLFYNLAGMSEFNTAEGKKKLEAVSGDKEFREALNAAIKNDPSVAKGLIETMRSADGKMSPSTLIDSLQDKGNRNTFTKVLNLVGQKPDDEFDFNYVKELQQSVTAGNYGKTRELLTKGGIKDDRLDMMNDPLKLLGQAMEDPKGFAKKMTDMMGLDGAQGQAFAKLFEGLGKYFQLIFGGKNGYGELLTKYGPDMKKFGEDLVGVTDREAAAAEGKPKTGTSATFGRATGQIQEPMAEPHAVVAPAQKVLARAPG